jgi:hypothetical protein
VRQRLISALGAASAALLFTSAALACFISAEPTTVRADANGRASFDAIIRWEHRKCVLDDDDVNIDTKGLKVLKQTGWQETKRGYFKNHFDIQLVDKAGSLRIWRECSKKGISELSIKIAR